MVDPILAEAIAGVMVESLFRVGGAASQGRRRRSKLAYLASEPRLTSIIVSLINRMEFDRFPSQHITKLAKFLRTPEAKSFVQQVKLMILSGPHRKVADSKLLQRELAAMMALCLKIPKAKANDHAEVLYRVISKALEDYVDLLQRGPADLYEESKALATQELNAGYLQAITQLEKVFRSYRPEELAATYQFVEEYCEQVHASTSYIIPPNLDERKQVPIDAIYIAQHFNIPDIVRQSTLLTIQDHDSAGYYYDDDEQNDELRLIDLQMAAYRLVILGDPGAGKSTLAQKLAYDYSTSILHGPKNLPYLVPFVIILRDYSRMQRERDMSILQYIETHASSEYQLTPPTGAVQYLLASGRAVVLFDGLDELLETNRRQQVTRAVEAFARKFPAAAIVVTSRKQGYMQAPLNTKAFDLVILDNLDDDSIRDYVQKWFSLDESLARRDRDSLSSTFLDESSSVADLRSNPLMLGLLCNVYRGHRYIPRNRAELYEKCALMLFEQWDASRGISGPGPLRADARFALQHIALWIYSTEGHESGIPQRKIIAEVSKYMLQFRFEHEAQSDEAAREFVELWRGRAWVLSDVASTPSGEPLYNFTHRTFLEYFAAVQLNRVCSSVPERLWDRLAPHVAKNEWDMVAQLAIQIANQNTEGAVDEIYRLLISSSQQGAMSDRNNLLSFAARYVDILLPGPRVLRELASAVLEFSFRGRPKFPPSTGFANYVSYFAPSDQHSTPFVTLIRTADFEQFNSVLDEIVTHCGRLGASGKDEVAARACAALLNIHLMTDAILDLRKEALSQEAMEDMPSGHEVLRRAQTLVAPVRQQIERLSGGDWELAASATRRDWLRAIDLVKRWGPQSLYSRAPVFWGPDTVASANSVTEYILLLLPTMRMCASDDLIEFFAELGRQVRLMFENAMDEQRENQVDLNWLTDRDVMERTRLFNFQLWSYRDQRHSQVMMMFPAVSQIRKGGYRGRLDNIHDCTLKQHKDAMFGAFYFVCVLVEGGDLASDIRAMILEGLEARLNLGCLADAAAFFGARGGRELYIEGKEVLFLGNLEEVDKVVLGRWIERRLSFVTHEAEALSEMADDADDMKEGGG